MYGVGEITAAQLMAEIGDVRRYPRRSSLVAFAGVDPAVNQSGKREAQSNPTTKRGSTHLRKTLYQIVCTHLKRSPADEPVYQFIDKKRSEGNRLLAGGSYDTTWKDFVCVNEMGGLISPNYISWAFPAFVRKNGLRKVRFHDLRHTNAVLLLSNGASIQEVQGWLGHENYSTTDEFYGGILAATKKRTAGILESVLNEKKKFG